MTAKEKIEAVELFIKRFPPPWIAWLSPSLIMSPFDRIASHMQAFLSFQALSENLLIITSPTKLPP